MGCFTEDGALESPVVGVQAGAGGDSGICRTLCPLSGTRVAVRHFISNLAVRVDGGSARATCYLLNVITCDGKIEVMAPGRYDCQLVKLGGEWLFKHRLVVLDGEVKLDGI